MVYFLVQGQEKIEVPAPAVRRRERISFLLPSVLFRSSKTGGCPPTLEGALCFTQLPTQMLIPSWIYSEIMLKQLSGQVTLTHKISHHVSTFFYVLCLLCLLFKNVSFMIFFWHCALGSKKKVNDGDAPWTPKPARSYIRT